MQMAGYENKIEIAHRTAVNNTTLHNACRINEWHSQKKIVSCKIQVQRRREIKRDQVI